MRPARVGGPASRPTAAGPAGRSAAAGRRRPPGRRRPGGGGPPPPNGRRVFRFRFARFLVRLRCWWRFLALVWLVSWCTLPVRECTGLTRVEIGENLRKKKSNFILSVRLLFRGVSLARGHEIVAPTLARGGVRPKSGADQLGPSLFST